MITKNKTKDVFLTKAQLQARIKAGTLEEGVIYHTIDENAGHALKVVDGTLQLLDVDNNVISEATLPPECDTAELDTIYYNVDGTLTDEQLTYLQSFKNLMFLKVKYNETSAPTIDIFLSKVRTVGTSQIVFTFNHSSGNMNIGFATNSLMFNLANKTYRWSTTSVGVITDHNIHYDVNGTLSSTTLSAMKEFADSGGNLLLHLIIGGVSSIGYDYLTYTSHEIAGKTKITFVSDGYKKIIIDLTTGAYTFEETSPEITYATDADIDGLFATYYTLTFSGDELSVSVNGKSVSSPFSFAKGDKIVVNNSVGNYAATINGTIYNSGSKTISLIDQDITITQGKPSMGTYSVTINTK